MRSGNNTHVQKHKTNVTNEEWNKTQNDAHFVAFYDMHAVTAFLQFLPFSSNLELSSANSFRLEESEICRLGKG